MLEDYLAYLTADPHFYDVAWAGDRVAGGTDLALPRSELPAGWTRVEHGPWSVYRPDLPLPSAGWKVHVAARPERAAVVVGAVVRTCLELGVVVKTLRSTRLVLLTQAKYAATAAAGKVVTAYPDEARLEPLLARLADLLSGERAARILGDLPVPGTPVSVRYGGFRGVWADAPDGRAVPGISDAGGVRADARRAHRATEGAPTPWPPVVRRLEAAAAAGDRAAHLDVSAVRVLHRSNAGGVYRATWGDGRTVVLKEARHDTGFDLGGADAVERLRHEHAALVRLDGLGVAPAPIDLRTVGDSDFLIMEYVVGRAVTGPLATTHPGVLPGGADPAPYVAWRSDVLARTAAALEVAHAAGVEHRDLHPSNLVDTGAAVVLVDWESSAVDGSAVATGVQAVRTGSADADATGLARLAVTLLTPLSPLLDHTPGLEPELVAVSDADLAAGGRLTGLPPGRRPPTGVRRLAAGIAAAATPDRADRLFPGDIAQFATPAAALGLLHGATGVLLALAAGGVPAVEEWTDWAVRAAHRVDPALRGVGDGLDGIAVALLRLGRIDDAARLASCLGPGRSGRPPTRAPWWATGRAGMAAVAAELAGALDDEELTRVVEEHVAVTLSAVDAAVDAGTHPAGLTPGLLHGWAGVALGLLRVADLTRDGGLRTACRDGARRAVDRELSAAVVVGRGLVTSDGRRLLPYLGTGSAALGCAAALLVREGVDRPDGSDDELAAAVDAVAETLRCPVVVGGGLLHGRSGNLLVLDRLAPGDPVVELHRQRLGWYVVPGPPVPGPPVAGPPVAGEEREVTGADVALGEHALRCSTDLATGSAGLLVAHLGGDPLAAVLPLPRARPAATTPTVTRNT